MKKLVPIFAFALTAGCFSAAPKPPVAWNIDVDIALSVSAVTVCAPYDGSRFAVLRPDGSVAFDAFNVFASRPAALVRSAVSVDPEGPELVVRRIALDCRTEGARQALVELQLRSGQKTVASAEASVATADGNFTKAFSAAFLAAAEKLMSGTAR